LRYQDLRSIPRTGQSHPKAFSVVISPRVHRPAMQKRNAIESVVSPRALHLLPDSHLKACPTDAPNATTQHHLATRPSNSPCAEPPASCAALSRCTPPRATSIFSRAQPRKIIWRTVVCEYNLSSVIASSIQHPASGNQLTCPEIACYCVGR
jgi:hypothetical protein